MSDREEIVSVQPAWCRRLPLQQQSVLLLAARGPDGIAKAHPCKNVVRAYRGTVLVAARFGRVLNYGEKADSFMSLDRFANPDHWQDDVRMYFFHVDSLPLHYHLHLAHGAQILGAHHPSVTIASKWEDFYRRCCEDLHLTPESPGALDARLNDWDRADWNQHAAALRVPAAEEPKP